MTSTTELVRRVPLFADLDDADLAAIAEAVEEMTVPAGTPLTHEGRFEGYFFVIVAGSALVDRDGRTVNELGPGDFFGEVALLDGGPRTATVIASSEMQLLALKLRTFDELMASSAGIRSAVNEAFGEHLRQLDVEGA